MNKNVFIFGIVFLLLISCVSAVSNYEINMRKFATSPGLKDTGSLTWIVNSTGTSRYQIEHVKVVTPTTNTVDRYVRIFDSDLDLLYQSSTQTLTPSAANGFAPIILLDGSPLTLNHSTNYVIQVTQTNTVANSMVFSNSAGFSKSNFTFTVGQYTTSDYPAIYDAIVTNYEWHELVKIKDLEDSAVFDLTARNNYDNTTINVFSANITNTTGTFNFNTTNGTITSDQTELVNITVYSDNHFPVTFTDYNTSFDLEANLSETNITFNIRINNTNQLVNFTTTFVDDLNNSLSFNTTTGVLNFDPNSNESITFRIGCQLNIFLNRTLTFNFTNLESNTYIIDVEPTLVNLTFVDDTISQPIVNGSINIQYPSGENLALSTDSDGSVFFSYVLNDVLEFGVYNITFLGAQGFISPISFFEEINESNVPFAKTYNVTRANLIINIFNRDTFTLLNTQKVDVNIIGLTNTSTTNGTVIIANQTIIPNTYTVEAISDGFITEQTTFTFSNEENLTINLYLLNATGNNTGTIFVSTLDEFFRILQGVNVELFEYRPDTLSYIKVSECLSNTNGECVFAVELNTKRYIITAETEINNIPYSASTNTEGSIFFINEDVIPLILQVSEQFESTILDNLVYRIDESFSEVTNISDIDVDFYTLNGAITEVCVQYFIQNGTSLIDLGAGSLFCENSSAAMLLINAQFTLTNRTYTYVAQVYQTEGAGKTILKKFIYSGEDSIDYLLSQFKFNKILVLFVAILILAFAMAMQNITVYLVLSVIWVWGQRAFLTDNFRPEIAVLQTVIIFVIFYLARRKEELN